MDNNNIKLISGIILAIVGTYLMIRESNPMGGSFLALGTFLLAANGYNKHKILRFKGEADE